MMDQAFISFSDAVAELVSFPGEIVDEQAGVRSHITECTIELPIELDVSRDESGALVLGSAPPLYYADTSFRPSYHRVRVTAVETEVPDAG
jgi:hypothetical protein